MKCLYHITLMAWIFVQFSKYIHMVHIGPYIHPNIKFDNRMERNLDSHKLLETSGIRHQAKILEAVLLDVMLVLLGFATLNQLTSQ